MREKILGVGAVVGVAVVAYTLYWLVFGGADRARPVPSKSVARAETNAQRATKQRLAPQPTIRTPARPAVAKSPARTRLPPAVPRPKPKVSLEQARRDYDDLLAEIDREIRRTEDTRRPLPNEDWVDLYRRGHQVVEPIAAHLGYEDPEGLAEVQDKRQTLRAKLQELQLGPQPEPEGE